MARPKKKKVEVVFDPQKRKEFLTGFRKRKNERRSRAKADLDRNLKEEHKRIRQEVKEGFKHLKKSFEPLRELTDEDKVEGTQKEAYEDDEVQVKIVELTTNDLAAQRNMLGANIAEDSEEEEETQDNNEDDENQTDRIPGMDFDINASRKRKADTEDGATSSKTAKGTAINTEIKSKKDLDKLMKTKTLKKIKKSKLFKMKERIDNKNNQKKAKRDRNNTIKSVPKHQRKKLKHGKNPGGQTRYHKGRMMNKKERQRKRGGGD
ncbi:nucleolar protein 12 [Drosophila innubila]|uniref:nucleolar protein 12 n=1 Tax=Drosophila innubila TaxID=198719 RepID=UPI00148CB733|nr:nucleolar protein 12 [Drosophila innubila]